MPIKRNRPKHYPNTKKYNGLYLWEIAQQLGVHVSTVYTRLKKHGTPYWKYQPPKHLNNYTWSPPTHPPERHGMSRTPEYKIYSAMITRCENPKHPQYCDYGERGITVCDRWRNSFVAFIEDVGRRPDLPNMTLERLDNDKGYEPSNVAWRSRQENQRNTRLNRNITWNGKTQCIQAWCNEIGLSHNSLSHRLKIGVPLDIAMTRPATPGERWDKNTQSFIPCGAPAQPGNSAQKKAQAKYRATAKGKEVAKKAQRDWYERHKAELAIKHAAYQQAHKEQINAKQRARRKPKGNG